MTRVVPKEEVVQLDWCHNLARRKGRSQRAAESAGPARGARCSRNAGALAAVRFLTSAPWK